MIRQLVERVRDAIDEVIPHTEDDVEALLAQADAYYSALGTSDDDPFTADEWKPGEVITARVGLFTEYFVVIDDTGRWSHTASGTLASHPSQFVDVPRLLTARVAENSGSGLYSDVDARRCVAVARYLGTRNGVARWEPAVIRRDRAALTSRHIPLKGDDDPRDTSIAPQGRWHQLRISTEKWASADDTTVYVAYHSGETWEAIISALESHGLISGAHSVTVPGGTLGRDTSPVEPGSHRGRVGGQLDSHTVNSTVLPGCDFVVHAEETTLHGRVLETGVQPLFGMEAAHVVATVAAGEPMAPASWVAHLRPRLSAVAAAA